MTTTFTKASTKRAFTLVELLVAIGVIAILLAILLPALAGVRGSARKTVTLSNLKQSHAAFDLYLARYDRTYPWFEPGTFLKANPEGTQSISPGYWDLNIYWPMLMHESAPWPEHFKTFLGSGARTGDQPWITEPNQGQRYRTPSFEYCRAFFVRPEFFDESADESPKLYRPVRQSDVTHPGGKVLLFDRELTHLQGTEDASDVASVDTRPMVFADGHAEERKLSEASTPAVPAWLAGRPATPLHDTRNGVRGRDY